jgi:hypothetical protein
MNNQNMDFYVICSPNGSIIKVLNIIDLGMGIGVKLPKLIPFGMRLMPPYACLKVGVFGADLGTQVGELWIFVAVSATFCSHLCGVVVGHVLAHERTKHGGCRKGIDRDASQ